MRFLIVNADDFGLSAERNAGILEAHRNGIVTSASIIAYGAAFREAVKIAKALPSLDIGLHLNLSEGEPLALGHTSLVGPDGSFWGKEEARRRAIAGLFNLGEVEKETAAQIETLQTAKLKVTHLDGHHHLHVYGALAEPIARAAQKAGVRCFRCPAERLPIPADLEEARKARIEEYRELALKAVPVYAKMRMRCTENFGGVAISGRLTPQTLPDVLKSLPEGLTELMVHPGKASSAGGFEGPAREEELQALTAPQTRALLSTLGITLTHFGKL